MNGTSLLGSYRPGTSVWHGMGAGCSYLVVVALTLPALVAQQWPISLAAMATSIIALLTTRLGLAVVVRLPWSLVALVLVLVALQVVRGSPEAGFVVAANLLTAVWAARLLICTTPAVALIDAVVSAAGRLPGVDAERVGLSIGLMLRSVPALTAAYTDVRAAVRARGLPARPDLVVTPVVVRAVSLAQASAEAMAARGLGESSRRMRT